MHCYFYADTTQQDDNFEVGMEATAHGNLDSEDKDTKQTLMNITMQAVGSVAKTPDMITYKIDTIDMDMEIPARKNMPFGSEPMHRLYSAKTSLKISVCLQKRSKSSKQRSVSGKPLKRK